METFKLAYLIICQLKPWLLAVGEDLPEDDAEAPHVTLRRELPVHDAFWWHPANGQHCVSSHLSGHHILMIKDYLHKTILPKILPKASQVKLLIIFMYLSNNNKKNLLEAF